VVGRLRDRVGHKHDDTVLRELVGQWEASKGAGWTDENALLSVFSLADRLNASQRARCLLCTYSPVAKAIEGNTESLHVRSWLGDPELVFHFPGPPA